MSFDGQKTTRRQLLSAIGMVDNATRTGFLTFMPFILIAKDLSVGGVGLAFALVFVGGAAGKFACGLVADRFGVIRTVVLTETATTIFILTVVTVAVASLNLGESTTVLVAVTIATIKATLVAMFFMNLKGEKPMVFWPLGLTAFLFVGLLVSVLLAEGDHLFGTEFGDAFTGTKN